MGDKYKKGCKGGENCHEEGHLCRIAGRKDFALIKNLVKDPRYVCTKCGRAAHSNEHLCRPEGI